VFLKGIDIYCQIISALGNVAPSKNWARVSSQLM
jgi:hypothetical protein